MAGQRLASWEPVHTMINVPVPPCHFYLCVNLTFRRVLPQTRPPVFHPSPHTNKGKNQSIPDTR